MAELAVGDLPAATRARFGSDAAAAAALDAVLAAARRHCGWHVSPARTEEITLDGPGGCILDIPTRRLTDVDGVTESGTDLDVDTLNWSTDGPHGARITKASGARWTDQYRAIVVDITHGFTEAQAADWRRAIIDMVDAVSYESSAGSDRPLKRKRVDDTENEWFDFTAAADKAVYSSATVLDGYQIPGVLFV